MKRLAPCVVLLVLVSSCFLFHDDPVTQAVKDLWEHFHISTLTTDKDGSVTAGWEITDGGMVLIKGYVTMTGLEYKSMSSYETVKYVFAKALLCLNSKEKEKPCQEM